MTKKYLFTSESVTKGHPDKMCDIISDAILDEHLKQDKYSRVACETAIKSNNVYILGEITSDAKVDIKDIVKKTIMEIGYTKEFMLDPENLNITIDIVEQSQDIKEGVDDALETRDEDENKTGAGDQGIIFGFACDETEKLMPAAIYYAQKLTMKLEEVRKNKVLDYLGPDAKSQVTVEYKKGKVKRIDTIVISTQHKEDVEMEDIRKDIIKKVIKETIPNELLDENTKYLINPSGRFVIGGPVGDAGLTGRKIIVDTYGGYAAHGGGAFSGKDFTKVDRSAAYMARYICKNVVANKLASKCEIELSYAIGKANPISINVNTFKTGNDKKVLKYIKDNFDMTPDGIIKELDLRRPIYKKTASGGHFGRDIFSWEKIK